GTDRPARQSDDSLRTVAGIGDRTDPVRLALARPALAGAVLRPDTDAAAGRDRGGVAIGSQSGTAIDVRRPAAGGRRASVILERLAIGCSGSREPSGAAHGSLTTSATAPPLHANAKRPSPTRQRGNLYPSLARRATIDCARGVSVSCPSQQN